MQQLTRALESAKETYIGLKWVNDEMITATIRRHMAYALVFLILGSFGLMVIPYIFGLSLDAAAAGDTYWLYAWLGVCAAISLIATYLNIGYDFFREHAWNAKYLSSNVTVMKKLLERTIEELTSDTSEIGVEQAEQIKDRVKSIIYLVLFEFSVVLVTIMSANLLTFTVDVMTGWLLCLLTVANLGWFFIWNPAIDEKMDEVDEEFRRANRRMVDKLTVAAMTIKANGVEGKTEHQVEGEIKIPLEKDLQIWAYWFLQIEAIRRSVNAIAPFAILAVGFWLGTLSLGEAAAVFTWVFLVSREYGFIGYLMRHLAGEVARLKAARLALSKPLVSRSDTGAPYVPQPLDAIKRKSA